MFDRSAIGKANIPPFLCKSFHWSYKAVYRYPLKQSYTNTFLTHKKRT